MATHEETAKKTKKPNTDEISTQNNHGTSIPVKEDSNGTSTTTGTDNNHGTSAPVD